MKKKLIQHLQILVLILIFLILSMKLWIQIMPDSESWIISDSQCDICTDEFSSLPVRILKKYKNKKLSDYDDGNLQGLEEIQYNHYYHEDEDNKNYQHDDNDHDINKTFTAADDFVSSGDDHYREQQKGFYIPPFKHKINDNIYNGDDNEQLITAYDYDFTIVTGASENHFCPLKSFLYNMNTELRDYRVHFIVYDLGFSKDQVIELDRLKEQGFLTEYRKFNYSYYPSFFNISQARGEYAWKPAIIAELARDYPGLIITWLDSGTFADKSYFRRLKSSLKYHKGFLSPRSSGFMKTWTHPGVYNYYNETDRRKYDTVPNCNGAVMSLDTHKAQKLIDSWYRCALVKDCIAPKGSSRLNHRQDQAIITYLAAKEKIFCRDKKKDHGVITHQDRFCKRYIAKFEKNLDNLKNNLK